VLAVSVNDLLGIKSKQPRKPGPSSELETRLEALRKLPRQRQKLVIELLDTILRDSDRT